MKKWRWPGRRLGQVLTWAVVLALAATSWASAGQTSGTSTSSSTTASAPAAAVPATTADPDQGAGDDHDVLDADGDSDENVQGLAVATAVLPQAMAGAQYGYQLTATGAAPGAAYTWSGTPPFGLTLSPGGLLSGTPASTAPLGPASFTVSVSASVEPVDEDDSGAEAASESPSVETHEAPPAAAVATASATLSLTLVPPIDITSGQVLPNGHVGVPYADLISASGGSSGTGGSQFSWTLQTATFVTATAAGQTANPGLPPGLSFSPDGVLSGTPTQAGVATLTLVTTNPTVPGYPSTGQTTFTKTENFTVTILPTTLQVISDVLPDATVGEPYNQTLQTNGGGTPNTAAGQPPYTWSVATGALPAGLSLSADGVLSGTPTTASVATFTAEATDNGAPASVGGVPAQQSASVLLDIVVEPASSLSIGYATLPAGTVGQSFGPVTFTVSGGQSPYTWSLAGSTPLPKGLSLSTDGVLSGTPESSFSGDITVQVSDAQNNTAQASFPLNIGAAGLSITTSALPDGTVGSAYPNVTFAATGGTGPYTWSLSSAGAVACPNASGSQSPQLPCGLSFSSGGVLSGTPASGSGGAYDISVQVTDSTTPTALQASITLPLTIKTAAGIAITQFSGFPNLPNAEETVPYSQILQATGGNGPSTYNWLLGEHAALPNGLQLQPYSCSSCGEGVISGTPALGDAAGGPSGNGQYSFEVQVTDNANNQATATLDLKVIPAVKITTTTVANAEVGTAYSATLTATGGSGSNSWSVSSGSLPSGLSLKGNGGTATISGTPTSPSSSANFTIQVKDANGAVATQAYSMTVFPAISVTVSPSTPPQGEVGASYSGLSFPATGGQGAGTYTWSASGLPAGLSINASTGAVTGTPTSAVQGASVTVQASDGIGSGSVTTSITIDPAISNITLSPTSGTAGSAYSGTLSASGGSGSYSWTASGLPSWLSLSGNKLTGTVPSGTTSSTTYSFSVTATDGLGGTATQTLTITG